MELLDGDEVREFLSKGLGFSREDRDTNVLRIGWVASTLAKHGVLVLAAVISPYAETRQAVRDLHDKHGAGSSRCTSRPRSRSARSATSRASTPSSGPARCPA